MLWQSFSGQCAIASHNKSMCNHMVNLNNEKKFCYRWHCQKYSIYNCYVFNIFWSQQFVINWIHSWDMITVQLDYYYASPKSLPVTNPFRDKYASWVHVWPTFHLGLMCYLISNAQFILNSTVLFIITLCFLNFDRVHILWTQWTLLFYQSDE